MASKPYAESPWKQRLVYFAGGLLIVIACGAFSVWFFGPYGNRPPWLLSLQKLANWVPFVLIPVLVVLRLVGNKTVRIGSYTLGAVLPVALLVGFLFFGDSIAEAYHERGFDAALWRDQVKAHAGGDWPPRLCMVDDLIASRKLDGLSEEQVTELLGPPDWIRDGNICYYLGPERGFIRIDSETLGITFSKDKRVLAYRLMRD